MPSLQKKRAQAGTPLDLLKMLNYSILMQSILDEEAEIQKDDRKKICKTKYAFSFINTKRRIYQLSAIEFDLLCEIQNSQEGLDMIGFNDKNKYKKDSIARIQLNCIEQKLIPLGLVKKHNKQEIYFLTQDATEKTIYFLR